MLSQYSRGMVFWATIPKFCQHINDGKRPVIIVSNNTANLFSPNVTVVPCTTNVTKNQPTNVHTKLVNGCPSVALCESVLTMDKVNLENFIGVLDDKTMSDIDRSLKIALGLGE